MTCLQSRESEYYSGAGVLTVPGRSKSIHPPPNMTASSDCISGRGFLCSLTVLPITALATSSNSPWQHHKRGYGYQATVEYQGSQGFST
jgi:hypothetical protein